MTKSNYDKEQIVLKRALQYFRNLESGSQSVQSLELDFLDFDQDMWSAFDSSLQFVKTIFDKFKPTKVEIQGINLEPRCENEWIIEQTQFVTEQGEIGRLTLKQEGTGYPRIDLRIEPTGESPETKRRLDAALRVYLPYINAPWRTKCDVYCRVPGVINDGEIRDFYLFDGEYDTAWGNLIQAGYWKTADLPREFCSYIDNGIYGHIKKEWYMRAPRSGYQQISGRGAIGTLNDSRSSSKEPVKFWDESQRGPLGLAVEFYRDPHGFINDFKDVEFYCMQGPYVHPELIKKRTNDHTVKPSN